MANVFRRGKFYYHYFTDAAGKQRKRSTGLTAKKPAQEDADAWIARTKIAKIRGFDAELNLVEAIVAYEAAGKSPRYLDKIADKWGHMKVRTIRPSFVRNNAKDIYPDASPATLNRQVITPVQAVINHAYQSEDGRQIKIEKFKVEAKKKQAVDRSWHDAFAAHAVSPGMAALARFMYETAARVSEAIRVKPEDVNLTERTVSLVKTKTDPRVARITQPMADMLAALMDDGPKRNRMNRRKVNGLFGYASRHAVYSGWKTTCERAGITYAPPHSSGRVSFATEMVVRKGVDPVTAAKLGGWASPKVMLDTYAKADAGQSVIDSVFDAPIENIEQKTPIADIEANNVEKDNDFNELPKKILRNRP